MRAGRLVGARLQPDERWQRLYLIRRQLQVAVGEENYSRAVELRNVITDLRETLPPAQQFLVQKLQELELGSSQEQEESLKAIGKVGGMDILGEVAEYLKFPHLEKAAQMALFEIWHRPPTSDPAIEELMTEGCKLLLTPPKVPAVLPQGGTHLVEAEKIFSQIIHLDPAFAEGWNKRATCRFHLASYQDSIHDCNITVGLNGYHFGAMVGQGMCHMKLREYRPAASSFQRALSVHPGLSHIRGYIEFLEKGAEEQEKGAEEQEKDL